MKSVVMSWEWWLCHVIRWGPQTKIPSPTAAVEANYLAGRAARLSLTCLFCLQSINSVIGGSQGTERASVGEFPAQFGLPEVSLAIDT